MKKNIFIFLFLIVVAVAEASHLEDLSSISDQSMGGHCPYFDDVSSNSYWLQWRVDNPPASTAISLNEVRFYSNASGTYNAGYALASNTFMFEGYWGKRRTVMVGGVGLEMMKHDLTPSGDYVSGPLCPDNSPSWVVYIFCPANTPAENNADPYGHGGDCRRNNHRGFQSKVTGKIYLSTGLWESQ